MKLLNAFSLNMLAEFPAWASFQELSLGEVREILTEEGFDSAVGHAETAAVFSEQLGVEVSCQRVTVTLKKGESALVGQCRGPRLPEGATTLPEGATIRWYLVMIS